MTMKYHSLSIGLISLGLLVLFHRSVLFGQEPSEAVKLFQDSVASASPVTHSATRENIAIAQSHLRSLGSVESYVRSALLLAMVNENETLEYYWLKADDPTKRLAIAAVFICQTNLAEDMNSVLKKEANRFGEMERSERLQELKWIIKNRVQIASALVLLLPDAKHAYSLRAALLRTADKKK